MDPQGTITVIAHIDAERAAVWELYTQPEHIMAWNQASDDWHTPEAENDVRPGGMLRWRMQAKDGSEGFDFEATYDTVIPGELLAYTMTDGRTVRVTFIEHDDATDVSVTFDAESENPIELQRDGWQAILDSFKRYAEAQTSPGL